MKTNQETIDELYEDCFFQSEISGSIQTLNLKTMNLNKDTHVFCEVFNFFGTIQELTEHIKNIGEYENYQVVTVKLANKEPFVDVDDNFLIDMVTREIEYQSEANERSSESGDEIEKVIELIVKHTNINYKALMEEMPELYYGTRSEITIDLDDFGKEVSGE